MTNQVPEHFEHLFRSEPSQNSSADTETARVETVDQDFVTTQHIPQPATTREMPRVVTPPTAPARRQTQANHRMKPRPRRRQSLREVLRPTWMDAALMIGLPLLGYVAYYITTLFIPSLPAPPTPSIPKVFEEERREEKQPETDNFPGFGQPTTEGERPRATSSPKSTPRSTPSPVVTATPSSAAPEASTSPTHIPQVPTSAPPIIVIPSILPTESTEPAEPSGPAPQPSESPAEPTPSTAEPAP